MPVSCGLDSWHARLPSLSIRAELKRLGRIVEALRQGWVLFALEDAAWNLHGPLVGSW